MPRSYSHLVSLIEALCDTLAECARVEAAKKPGKFALERARDIRAATEPLAIECLDEETCDLPLIVRKVYGSASLKLVDHLEALTDRTCIMPEEDWSLLLMSTDVPTINALLDRRLSPVGALLPILREIQSGKARLIDTLLVRIAPKTPLETSQLDKILTIRWKKKAQTAVDITAQVLRLQATECSAVIASEAAKGLDERLGQLRASVLILAGLKPDLLISMASPKTVHGKKYIERITSSHGLLSLHQACGSLEGFLLDAEGQDGWIEWISRT